MITNSFEAVVIGASAGAIEALAGILPVLPEHYPQPIMVVVHLPADRPSVISNLFQERCKIRIKEAEDKEPLLPGTIYFSPPDYHLLVEKGRRLSLSNEEEVRFSRPSIDVLFETAADAYGERLLGVILSGANDDGSRGLKAVIDAGGRGLVLRPDHAYASAMPLAALHVCKEAQALTLEQIAAQLLGTEK